MWNCVLAGMAQTKQVVRAQGIAVPTFKPDPGEMRSVSEPPATGARAFHIKPLTRSAHRRAQMPGRCACVLRRTVDAVARGQKRQRRQHCDDHADAAPVKIYPLHVSHLLRIACSERPAGRTRVAHARPSRG